MHNMITTVAIGFILGLVSACAAQTPNSISSAAAPQQRANPASEKCIRDGYTLLPERAATGIVTGHQCLNPSTGKRCEQWAYLRQQCFLK
jgi:putative hemolysin